MICLFEAFSKILISFWNKEEVTNVSRITQLHFRDHQYNDIIHSEGYKRNWL